MTDRVHSLTVVLEADIRADEVQALIAAIRHLRGVTRVTKDVVGVKDAALCQIALDALCAIRRGSPSWQGDRWQSAIQRILRIKDEVEQADPELPMPWEKGEN